MIKSEKVGGANDMSRWINRPAPPLADNPAPVQCIGQDLKTCGLFSPFSLCRHGRELRFHAIYLMVIYLYVLPIGYL